MEKEIKRSFWEIIKRFFEPYKENRLIFTKWICVSILWSLNWILHVIFLERISHSLELWDNKIFFNLLKYYLFFIFLYEILVYSTKKWWWVENIPKSWDYLSKKYLKQYIQLNNNLVEVQWTWKLISIIYWWVRQWWFSLWNFLEVWIKVIITFIFSFYMISKVSTYYWIIFIVLSIIFLFISVYFSNLLQIYRKARNDNINLVSKETTKVLMNKTEILQSNKIDKENQNISNLYKIDSRINKDMWIKRNFMKRSSEFWISIFFIISYYILWDMFFNKNISLNIIIWFWWALILMQRTISEALSFYIQFTKDFIIIEKLWDFFDSTPEIQWYETWKDFIHTKWDIKLKKLTYWYISDIKIFDNFNLNISWWKVTALVWLSGSWKSTLVKLIAWYIRADSWKIIIDNQNLNEVSLKTYYKDIWYLTQEPSVFDWTIFDNLTYALDNNVRDEKFRPLQEDNLDKIIKLSKCEFIYDLPNWINTEIWERWVRLSWWQRQRLAIAKIFLKNPKIIILDEPTSALDSFSEELITKAMHNLFKDRTVIIIAHRLQTVKHADDIILLEDWKIKERWTHKELVKKKWIYNRMLELQSGF